LETTNPIALKRVKEMHQTSSSYQLLTCWSLFCNSDFAASSSSICLVKSRDGISWPFCN